MNTHFDPSSVAGLPVRDLVDQWAAQKPDAVFLIDPDAKLELTFKDLHRHCAAFASRLNSHGVSASDRVAYAMNNGADTVRVVIGSLYGGQSSPL